MLTRLLFRRIRNRLAFQRQHKYFASMVSLYVVVSALSAIKHNSDGSWPMPVLLFYLAVFLFVVGSAEIIFVLFKHYRTFDARCQAISRALSCYGVVFTIIVMCDLYLFTVRY